MGNPVVVRSLTEEFNVPVRDTGLKASVQSLFKRQFSMVEAVRDISFDLEPGEIVGFLGPNGAGETTTTTIKMLTGLLHPTSGNTLVLGYPPW